MFRFERLTVWQEAAGFARLIYQATARFPSEERFGLVSQMRRASISIASNIAEGSSRSSDSDFARFVEIAYGSLMELTSQSQIAKDLGFLSVQDYQRFYDRAECLSRMLSGLRQRLLRQCTRREEPKSSRTQTAERGG